MDADTQRLWDFLHSEYVGTRDFELRLLEDGTIAGICNLATTRSIMLDMDYHSWTRRFCFDDPTLADRRFQELKSSEEIPAGYIARRPQFEDHADPYLNDLHNRPWYRQYEKETRK